jgi:hypothetical protein
MSELTIPVKDDALLAEILVAFGASFDNSEGLSANDLVVTQLSNFIMNTVNQVRVQTAVQAAQAGVVKITSLTS